MSDADLTGDDVLWGLIYAHDRANANTSELETAAATLAALVELLVARGVLSREDLDEARGRAVEEVRRRFKERGMAVFRQDHQTSKYDFEGGPVIDCASRVHLCKASCCKLRIGLSEEDIREGLLRWDTAAPYELAKKPDHSCVHLESGSCRCSVYSYRPMPCRTYDCRKDSRIWTDFDAMVPNPAVEDPDWPLCLHEEQRSA
jgi:Putative zinc- or iron-chelating domain